MDKTMMAVHDKTEQQEKQCEVAAAITGGEGITGGCTVGAATDKIAVGEGERASVENQDEGIEDSEHQETAKIEETTESGEIIEQKRTRLGVGELGVPVRAAASDNVADVEFLVSHGVDVDERDDTRCTPLFAAAENGHLGVVNVLLVSGAEVDADEKDHETPLSVAAKGGHVEVLEALIASGADVTHHAFYHQHMPITSALEYGQARIVQHLLRHGTSVSESASSGQRPLYFASTPEVVEILLEHGTSVDETADFNETPLHRAAEKGYADVAKKLIERGASVDARDKAEIMPLFHAAKYGHVDVARVFLKSGASIDAKD